MSKLIQSEIPHFEVAMAEVALPLSDLARAEIAQRSIELPPDLVSAVASRQESYLAGRLCAARALADGGAGPSADSPAGALCGRSPGGAPVWPPGFVGSIAHTGGIAIAAVSRGARALGIDIEGSVTDWERVLARVGRPEEQALPAGWSGSGPSDSGRTGAEWTALVFSAKESVYKALHPLVGRYFGFAAARIELAGPGRFRWTLTEDLGAGLPADMRAGEGTYSFEAGRVRTLVFVLNKTG